MTIQPVVGDKYLITYEQLGRPTHRQDVQVPGLGLVVLDEADIHFGKNTPDATYFVRPSGAIPGAFIVVSRVHPA
ncbi:MAG: hypothetical protein MH204_05500 [Fimbriimonadaceae bacterium]|nr:hypothetical protein [Fimbriimonadaceae bacterium]